jgi:hypothetical protein
LLGSRAATGLELGHCAQEFPKELTNPLARLVTQGGAVDWYRFWLQGYEDPDPAKAEQYERWEDLCSGQVAENRGRATFCVASKH